MSEPISKECMQGLLKKIIRSKSDLEILTEILATSFNLVEKLLVGICKSHGIEHIVRVFCHGANALQYEDIYDKTKIKILLACINHDVGDHKFSLGNSGEETLMSALRQIPLGYLTESDIDDIRIMIDLVSSSKYGDSIPYFVGDRLWMLIPRHADRLEAVGFEGVKRCYTYSKGKGMPLWNDQTPIPSSLEEIGLVATEERYKAYRGNSVTMIDHYYDKLFHVGKFSTTNPYFLTAQSESEKPLIDVIQHFMDGTLTEEYFETL